MLLTTKFHPPLQRIDLVDRPRLVEKLEAGLKDRRLTVVSGPAGFGKTTLITDWLRSRSRPYAWLWLDEGDNDPVGFWRYVIAAMRTFRPQIGQAIEEELKLVPRASVESLVGRLVNEIVTYAEMEKPTPDTNLDGPLVLVLDDYHVIENEAVHRSMSLLLDRLPPTMHVILTTRTEPPLSLPRRRARQELNEIRTADLRFTRQETVELFNRVMGLGLSPDDLATLDARTEGWVASLQLAGLSLRKHPDRSAFIRTFAGTNQDVEEYLIEEVFSGLSKSTQEFLLHTSILTRLSGSLCDAVVGGKGTSRLPGGHGQTMLRYLDRSNLFTIPLDSEHKWYRYHQLFADLLRERLQRLYSEQVSEFHRRAARWYEQEHLSAEALHHIMAIGDYDWAGRLIEQNGERMLWVNGELAMLQNWLNRLPGGVVQRRPMLSILQAVLLYVTGQIGSVEPFVKFAESHLRGARGRSISGERITTRPRRGTASPNAVETTTIQRLKAVTSGIRCLVTILNGNQPRGRAAVRKVHNAMRQLPAQDQFLRGLITSGLAEAYYLIGDAKAAVQAFTEAAEIAWSGSHTYLASICMSRTWDAQVLHGQLRQAAVTCKRMARRLEEQEMRYRAPAGLVAVHLGELNRQWNDLGTARECLLQGIEHFQAAGERRLLLEGYVPLAFVLQAQGDGPGALTAMEKAVQIMEEYRVAGPWGTTVTAAYQAKLWLLQRDAAAATRWAEEEGLRPIKDPTYEREMEFLVYARVLLAHGRGEAAALLLERIIRNTRTGGRRGRMIEAGALRALALQLEGRTKTALDVLRKAVEMAEPEGYVRVFVDEGPPMARLLSRLADVGDHQGYVERLLEAFDAPDLADVGQVGKGAGSRSAEILSRRELDVLRLLAAGMSNREIASRLHRSLNTVKVHAQNIFAKLLVRRRTQAVAEARRLGILR